MSEHLSRKRGRPQHEVTTETVEMVTMLLALGWSHDRMANALGITPPTFRKHYFSQVRGQRDGARDRLDAAYAAHLWGRVREGNIGAMRLWLMFLDRNDRMGAEAAMAAVPDDKPADKALGKKLLDQQRAFEADADLTAELENEAASDDVSRRH